MLLNKYELNWIMKAAEVFKSSQEDIIEEINIMPFELHIDASAELLKCANNLEFAEALIAKIEAEQEEQEKNAFVALDADHQGELLVLCAELHSAWDTNPHIYFEGKSATEIGYEYYMLGNVEGRLKTGRITLEDLGMLDAWKEEMEA